MTITQLRAFLTALEFGSFTAAADELDMTQASVSELVARLERELGTPLFTRGGRQLMPTEAARALRPHAEQATAATRNAEEAVRAVTSLDAGTCTFGVLRNAAYYNLSDLVQNFHQQHPRVRVRLLGLNSALVAASIAAGEIEAGLVVLPVEESGLNVTPLFRDEVVFASADRGPADGPIDMAEFCDSQLVLYDAYAGQRDPTRRQLSERARLAGLSYEPAIEVEHVESALGLVATGGIGTVVARTIAESTSFPENVMVTPFEEPLYDTIALARRSGALLSPATERFAALTRRTLMSTQRQSV